MNEQDRRPAKEPNGAQGGSTDDAEVRDTMERTRRALDASLTEIERSKRLLRETEELVELPVSPPPGSPSDKDEPS